MANSKAEGAIPANEKIVQLKIKNTQCLTKIISAKSGRELKYAWNPEAKEFFFEKVPVNEFIYEDFHVLSMAQNKVGNQTFGIELKADFTQVGLLSGGEIAGILVCIVVAIVFYTLSMLHVSKKVDLFKVCKKKPLSPEELARIKNRKAIQLALEESPPSKQQSFEQSAEITAKEEPVSLKDSFFADDPYIGHKVPRGLNGSAPAVVPDAEACLEAHNPNTNIGL